MTEETNKVKNIINLLQFNEDYSKVLTLKNFISTLILKNIIFKTNFDKIIPKTQSLEKIKFFEFLNKTVICFPNTEITNFKLFLFELPLLSNITINGILTINDLLSQSMIQLLESNTVKDIYLYCQLIGIQMESFRINRFAAFKNSNRLLNSSNFEIFRLLVGDDIFCYIIKFCSVFLFDEKIQNYIQILGFSIKEKLLKLLNAQSMSKFVSSINSNNFSYKNNSEEVTLFQSRRVYIPIQNFNVERTKIFYCTNFNRKLGLFKNAIFIKNNRFKDKDNINNYSGSNNNFNFKDSTFKHVEKLEFASINKDNQITENNINPNNIDKKKIISINNIYTKMFDIYLNLIPDYLEVKIKNFIEIILKKITNYTYYKKIFKFCPIRKDWKNFKSNLKNNINHIKEFPDDKKNNEKIMENISNDFIELLNSTVEYEKVYKFIKDFLHYVIPKEFIGSENLFVIIEKLKLFISMNRFETLNKVNLFDSKEFSFKEMKWLEFNKMSKTTFCEIGLNLKNFIMKNLIFWIFDFLIVQLVRSHFYVTEKQGDHYKTFYYHKKDWDLIMKINEIKFKNQFSQISKKDAIDILLQKDLTFGKLRLVPKPTTCRPIISYKKRTMRTKALIKNILFETQKIFKYLSNIMQSKRDNSVVFDYRAIILKLRKFKEELNISVKKFVEKNLKENSEYEKKNNSQVPSLEQENIDSLEICNKNNLNICSQTNLNKINQSFINTKENLNNSKNIYLETIKRMNSNSNERDFFDLNNFNFTFSQDMKKDFCPIDLENLNDPNNFCDFENKEFSFLNYSTLDIEGCYDNIDIEKMIEIIDTDDLISEEFASNVLFVVLPKQHMLNKTYTNNVTFKDCFEIKKLFYVTDNSEYLHFLDFLKGKGDLNYSYCILYQDYNNMSYIRKRDFLPRIKNIIQNNIIKFNKKFFKQTKGIPQGLSVSSFLCNLYFYNIEKNLCRQYYQNNSFSNKLLLRFMDDYLCVSSSREDVVEFVEKAKDISNENKFKFNMKKSKNNLENNPKDIPKNKKNIQNFTSKTNNINKNIIFSDNNDNSTKKNTKNKINWNGINFELESILNFNMLIDSKENYDLKQYSTLININLPPVNNKNDYNWLNKKISSIFLTGHPWIYFISELNNLNVLKANFKDFCHVITFKLIIFTNILSNSSLKPSQYQFIEIIDSCLKKLYYYFNNKTLKGENKLFFLKDFEIFTQMFYFNIYDVFENSSSGKLNNLIINKSPFLFKCIRRKILRLKRLRNLNHEDNFI